MSEEDQASKSMEPPEEDPRDGDEEMEPVEDEFDPDRQVERRERGVSLKLKSKRGTGTRDQDEVYGKIRAPTAEEAREQVDELTGAMEEALDAQRDIQPGQDDEGDDE